MKNGNVLRKPVFEHEHRPRHCDICRRTYHRVQKMDVWTTTNFGHRMGWIKETLRLCCKCFDQKKAVRIVSIASASVRVA